MLRSTLPIWVLATLCVTAGAAGASTAGFAGESNNFVYFGDTGERNDVVIGPNESNQLLRVTDGGATIQPGPMCVNAGSHEVRCSSPFQAFGGQMFLRDAGVRADVQSVVVLLHSGGGSDVIRSNAVSVYTGGGADTITGTGTRRPDRRDPAYSVNAGPGDDTVIAGPGSYVLVGDPGRDRLTGGAGNDTIGSVDAEPDTVACGGGHDAVTADEVDSVADDCEEVERRARLAPPPAAPRGVIVVRERRGGARARAVRVLTVRRASDGHVVFRSRSKRPLAQEIPLVAGRYRITTYTRGCAGRCRRTCATTVRLQSGRTVSLLVTRRSGRACRVRRPA